MYFCDNYALAVMLCVVTMFCWGSWGNTQKLAGKTWRYELFYWDYVIGILLFSLAMGLTMGSCGERQAWGFVANLKSSFGESWIWPILSGVIFNASNILLAAAISVAGMSVAFPVGVGLALVGGTLLNYAVKRQGSATLIGIGLLLIVVSILCNALAFKAKQSAGGGASDASSTKKGLILAALAGFMMMWFSPLVNRVVDLAFTAEAPREGMLTPYTGFFLFSIGIFVSNFVFNTIAMRKPVQGEPILDGAKCYFGGSPKTHLVGILGGCIWGLGTLLSFVSAGKAGPAVSYALGQGATLVSALWGILVWREFAGAPRKSALLNCAMFVLFVSGLGALVMAGDSGESKKEPVKVIFDTDMITDFDDVGALACLHALADAGECEILATVSSTRGNASVGAIEVINSYYGRSEIPVGAPKGMGVLGERPGATVKVDPKSPLGALKGAVKGEFSDGGHYKYRKLLADYPGWYRYADADESPDANEVYRRVLAGQPNGSVVICSVGFLTNMRRLLETKPDGISSLDGKALVSRKVKKWVAMACKYPKGKEYNSKWDAESSRIALEQWPTPVVFSDVDYGFDVHSGRVLAESPEKGRNPVRDVFAGNLPGKEVFLSNPAKWLRACYGLNGRSSWDQTAVLAAVRGESSYFNVNRGRYRMIGKDGEDEWSPEENGPHMRITEKVSKAEVGRIIDELICRAPNNRDGK